MISKRLIFIWLGSELPKWGQFCMDNFKKVNPDFEIMFVYEPDMNNIKNQDLKNLITIVENSNDTVYHHMLNRKWIRNNLITDIGRIVALSDIFRVYLLNKYGGIYLDLDTFPIKPFDSEILKHEYGFAVNHKKNRTDWFFIGMNSGFFDDNILIYNRNKVHWDNRVYRLKYDEILRTLYSRRLQLVKYQFIDCKLMYGERIYNRGNLMPSEYYIDHYRINTWSK